MRKVTIKVITIGLMTFSFLNFSGTLLAWEGKPTHKVLTKYAADNSVLSVTKGDYLKNIGFTNSLDERFAWKKFISVREWLQEGSELEDAGNIFQVATGNGRFMNHFHNPLKEWESAGLDDLVLFLHYTGDSSVLWAQNGDNQLNFPEGNWSWQQIKDCYYLALTSETEEERQENFAKTFRGLGHQMHLIQDVAVPAHVRNDAHPFAYNRMMGLHIEKWAAEAKNINYVNSLAENPIFPAVELNTSYQTFAPITQFIDTIGANKYDGSNPSTSLSIGLAEYANANFFSNDTIFTEDYSTDHRHYFPYPKKSSTNLQDYLAQTPLPETRMAQDGVEDIVLPHIIKNNDGENINHFVRPGYYTNYFSGEGDTIYYRTFYIDEQCHEDYAEKLIPRAVGYSAGLLDYFFRGEIDMVPDEENGNGYIIKNNSDEDLEGTLSLYYDNESDERVQIESGDFPLEVSIPGNNKSSNVNFTIPNNPKEPGKYILVFKGKLGNEEGAVAGKIVDINPYLLITIDGGTDREICFVWNITENKYAYILDTDSNPIAFPCNKNELTIWLSNSYSVGESLFNPLPGCDNTRLEVSCDTPEGCWDFNGECNDEIIRASSCVDMDGSPLMNVARINRSDETVCHVAPYCADNNQSVQKQIITEGSCYEGIRSMRLAARNDSGIVTSVRTKEEYTQDYTKHYFNDGSGCNEMGLAYLKMDDMIERRYTIFTPIGELVQYDLSQENYALWHYFEDPGEGNQTDESIQNSLYGVNDLYYGNAIVQLYYYDYLMEIKTRPCGIIPWSGFWIPCNDGVCETVCEYDSFVYYSSFSVCAQADVVKDPDNQDPTQLSRNNKLEGAIRSLREKFENEYGNSSGVTLTYYKISIDLRIEK